MQRLFCLSLAFVLIFVLSCKSPEAPAVPDMPTTPEVSAVPAELPEESGTESVPESAPGGAVLPSGSVTSDTAPAEGNEPPHISIPAPSRHGRTLFSPIDENILSLVEDGSAGSLRSAASTLYRGERAEYSEAELTLLYLCREISAIAWPGEALTYAIPEITERNQYTEAVASARNGIYDLSMSNTDFLSLTLPSLTLLTAEQSSGAYYDTAGEALSAALSLRPDSTLANYLLGVLYVRQGRAEEALDLFKKCNTLDPSSREIQLAVAEGCFLTGEYELSLSVGESLLSSSPQDEGILSLCMRAAFALGDYDKAESYVIRALLIDSENIDYILMRTRLLVQKGDYIRASSFLDAVAGRGGLPKEYYILRTEILRDWNRAYSRAVETAEEALNAFPDDTEVLLLAAQTASRANATVNNLSAVELAGQVIERDSGNRVALSVLIEEYIKEGDYSSAYNISSAMIGSLTYNDDAYYSHIEACLDLGYFSEAAELAERAYEALPGDERAAGVYIRALRLSGRAASAADVISELLPNAAQSMRSVLFYERSFLEDSESQALSDLRSSLTANPRNIDALYRLYEIYFNRDDLRRAQYYLRQVISIDPANPLYLEKSSELNALLAN